ncbi:MAG: UDP-glucose/GDP-mannose dehydrogenase family protein [Chloroflexi bacterium]|nr:UDP-glucose/GDP-mannose dehydrogenase family protein [Chloroflexota bacterium]
MKVVILGLGYVGSVASAAFARSGHEVLGLDINREVVSNLASGNVVGFEPGLKELLASGLASGRLRLAHVDDPADRSADLVMVCVGTPSLASGGANLAYVRSALEWAIRNVSGASAVVMKSTVPPGTGKRLKAQFLDAAGIGYVSNPEFLREGNAVHDWFHPDRIVIGASSPIALKRMKALYHDMEAPVVATDVTSAEMIKYAANAFLATKIAFVNEIANLCERLDAHIDDVTHGIGLDPRIGSNYLRPGLGYGGSCFPKDVRALDFLSTSNGHSFELLRSVITVNNRQRLLPLLALREVFGALQGVKVAVLGIAFKPDTDDTRDAPALDLVPLLVEEGMEVRAYDPAADARKVLPPEAKVCGSVAEAVEGAQAVVLATEWREIVSSDWAAAARRMAPPRLLFDGRNALDPDAMARLGFEYRGVGRRGTILATSNTSAGSMGRALSD